MSRERHLGGMRRLLQLPASPQRIDKDIEDEIRFHIESRIAELIGMGALEHEARARAEQEYGNVRESRHELMRVDRRRARRGRRSESADAFVPTHFGASGTDRPSWQLWCSRLRWASAPRR
jgi:hypothetical protein